MEKKELVIVLFFLLATALVSVYVGMHICDSKDENSIVEPGTGSSGDAEENTWLFKDRLTSNDDSDTYEIDLRDNPLGGLLIIEFTGPQGLGSHPYKLTLLDGDRTPVLSQHISSGGSKSTQNAVVDGGEIYYVLVETWGDRHDAEKPYIAKIEFIPHSSNNSPETAIPVTVPGRFEGRMVSGKDVNYLAVGPVNTSGLLVVESSGETNQFFEIKLLDDKGKIIQEYMPQSIRYPVDDGSTYYIKAGRRNRNSDQSSSYVLDIDLIPNSVNSNPDNAIPINMPQTVKSSIVSIKDSNWFKLDLRGYSDGDIVINFAVPDKLFNEGGSLLNGGEYKMELLEDNAVNILGSARAFPGRPASFARGLKKNVEEYYPEDGIEGGRVYYIKVYSERNYHPTDEYTLEIKSDTMVPVSVDGERPNRYTLEGNTVDSAVVVELPARMEGRLISAGDVHWFKVNLADYVGGGVLSVNFTMPSKTEPSCGFVCKQPVCFNPPQTPPDCYHYQFEVFGGDRKTGVLEGSVAPGEGAVSREALKSGDMFYFKVSAPHGRYNREEPYTMDVRFYPNK